MKSPGPLVESSLTPNEDAEKDCNRVAQGCHHQQGWDTLGPAMSIIFGFRKPNSINFSRTGPDFCARRPLAAVFLDKSWHRTTNTLTLLGVSILRNQCAVEGELAAESYVAVETRRQLSQSFQRVRYTSVMGRRCLGTTRIALFAELPLPNLGGEQVQRTWVITCMSS